MTQHLCLHLHPLQVTNRGAPHSVSDPPHCQDRIEALAPWLSGSRSSFSWFIVHPLRLGTLPRKCAGETVEPSVAPDRRGSAMSLRQLGAQLANLRLERMHSVQQGHHQGDAVRIQIEILA